MIKKIFSTKQNSLEAFVFSDPEVEKAINEKYKFECAYHPDGYDVVFICQHDNREDSRKDIWKAVFFKKKQKRTGTITLDNVSEMNNSSEIEVVFFKEVDGNYEDMINISVDIIKKYMIKVGQQNGAE